MAYLAPAALRMGANDLAQSWVPVLRAALGPELANQETSQGAPVAVALAHVDPAWLLRYAARRRHPDWRWQHALAPYLVVANLRLGRHRAAEKILRASKISHHSYLGKQVAARATDVWLT